MNETLPSGPKISKTESSPEPSFFSQVLRALGEIVQTVLIAGLLFLAINLLTARIRVEGISMEPTLHEGQFVIVNRLAYRWQDPERGDIIVFHFPLDEGRRFIKRVIGLPGDTVAIEEGQIFVNGRRLSEPYITDAPRYSGEWIVGEDELFVLGDNRNNSSDSQNWGTLPYAEVIGKAVVVYWPLDDAGPILHYDLIGAASN